MKHYILLLVTVLLFNSTYAQQEKYSRVKVSLDMKEHTMMQLARLGVAVDHGDYRKGQYFISDFSETEIKAIRDAGFKTEIQIDDVSKYYREQNEDPAGATGNKTSAIPCDTSSRPDINVPSHFHLGTYAGGYYSYTEMLNILDSMHFYFPNLISTRQQISGFTSVQGRPLYWIRVSNNPSVKQPLKPEVLYTALHHAREPGSLSSMIFYLWYLLENYNTDPTIKAIVDNTEMYFIPCVNPDGYIYNITTNPNGGGMWRKNKGGSSGNGTDLNRNYGYLWGYDNIGSSPFIGNETYRGAFAFSEPETQAVKWFCEQYNFKLALNYHTFNNELLSPFGHVEVAYPDDSFHYSAMSVLLTKDNFYRYGTCFQCLGYVANGGSDDWMYAEQSTKNRIFGFTPEVGSVQNGFYPPTTQIIPDCKNGVQTNLNAVAMLLPYAKLEATDPNILTSTSGYIHYNLQHLGFGDTGTYNISVEPLDNWLTLPTTVHAHTNPGLLQNIADSFSYTIAANTPNNQSIRYVLKMDNGYYITTDTVEFFYGKYYTVTTPSMASFSDWTNTDWSINNVYAHTPPSSFKSSPTTGNYPDNSTVQLQLKNSVDLHFTANAYLQFYARWDIEPKYDYLVVEASQEGTNQWTPLCGRFTKPGDYSQPIDAPVYDDHQFDWFLEQMDLRGYIGSNVNIRFTLQSDAGSNYDGFYLDDVQVTTVVFPDNVRNIDPEAGFAAYPNPASDHLTIRLSEDTHNATAGLYDCLGRQVKTMILQNKTATIETNSLPGGLYYLKVYNNGKLLPVQKVELLK